jgi:hypothetical protein
VCYEGFGVLFLLGEESFCFLFWLFWQGEVKFVGDGVMDTLDILIVHVAHKPHKKNNGDIQKD